MNHNDIQFDISLPVSLPKIRPAGDADAERIARWVESGRREAAFLMGEAVDAPAVLRYQRDMRQSGWQYECMIVEDEVGEIGYLDYRYQNDIGEILGIYLDGAKRHRHIGQFLLRWSVANLRELGCRKVCTEVYANNSASLHAFQKVGFERNSDIKRSEGGRQIQTLYRYIQPLSRFSPPETRYTSLQGDNIYLQHVAVAETLAEVLRLIPGVGAILGLGSLARGFADKWSDIDIAVLGQGPGLEQMWRGERYIAGQDIDLFVVDLKPVPPGKWDESRRQAFEECVVLFAQDKDIISQIQRGLRLSEQERIQRIQETLLKIGWIGFQPRNWFDQRRYGYEWTVPHDLWMQRGSLSSAHNTVDQAFDFALHLLFLLNGRHVPDPKWLHYLAPGLSWLPDNFTTLMETLSATTRDEKGFTIRAEALFLIVEQAVRYLEETGVIKGELYKDYLSFSSDYDPQS